MDINCTNDCLYQVDGKCTLNKLSMPFLDTEAEGLPDCAYFSSRCKKDKQ